MILLPKTHSTNWTSAFLVKIPSSSFSPSFLSFLPLSPFFSPSWLFSSFPSSPPLPLSPLFFLYFFSDRFSHIQYWPWALYPPVSKCWYCRPLPSLFQKAMVGLTFACLFHPGKEHLFVKWLLCESIYLLVVLFQLLILLDNLLLLANCICCHFPPCKGSKGLKQRRCFQILAPNLLNFTVCPFLHLKSVPIEMRKE